MKLSRIREPLILLIGDTVFLVLALILALVFRFGYFPGTEFFYSHLVPFSYIFLISLVVFFIAGLYEKHTVILKNKLPNLIFGSELTNSVVAIAFFYFIPYFGITPKTILFIYVVVSACLIFVWRLYLSKFLIVKHSEKVLLIGTGKEMGELYDEVNNNVHYGLNIVAALDVEKESLTDLEQKIIELVRSHRISLVIIDLENDKTRPIVPKLYSLIFSNVSFIAMNKIYEDVFKRIPFFILRHDWFLENISSSPKKLYDLIKRTTDIVLATIVGLISLAFYPFVYVAIKLDDHGPIFIIQERIGQGEKNINIVKFRSMKTNDKGVWVKEKDDRITRVGKILRKTRIDELPQLWNVFKGDMSLIGPRPDIRSLGLDLAEKIPYYNVRYTVKPGLSGWAQMCQDLPPQSLEETTLRLAYDLYYVKNRSVMLDYNIILKTIRILVMRTGK